MYSSPQTVDMYVCQKMWFSIELLAEIQRKFFIHCKEARIDATQLHSVIEHAERIYVDLKLSPEVITAIKSIEKEPIAATSVLEQMQLYRDKWTREQRLYEEVTCNATELKVDVDELRVQDVSEQNTPRTQMGTEKELQQPSKTKEKVLRNKTEVKQNVESTGDPMQTSSLQEHEETSDGMDEQRKCLESHTQELQKNDSKLQSAETQSLVMKTKQRNVSERVSYAVHEINELSKSQRKTNEELKQTQEVMHESERQLLDEVNKTKEIVQQMSSKEKETLKQITLLETYVSTMQKQLQEAATVGNLHILNPSDFTADVKYHAKEYHCETRKWLLDEIEQWRIESTTKVRLSLVTGNPGMGKSVLTSQLCTIASGKGILAACFFFQHHKMKRNNPRILVQTLAYQLCFAIPGYKEEIEKCLIEEEIMQMNIFELFTELVLTPLNNTGHVSEQKLIVIDGLDECDFEQRGDLLKLILREFVKLPEWIRVIMTTRPDQYILKKLTRIKSVFQLNPDDPRNINDIKLYLHDILKERMQTEELESGLEIMVRKSEGMFLYFHYASEAILEHNILTLDDLNTLLPDGIDDYYEQNFRRLQSKLGKDKYQLLFQAITAARSEFPKALIGPLLNVSDAESSQIMNTVSVLLPVHNGYVSMFHKSIRDWLKDRDLAEDLAIDSTPGHSDVADICNEEFKTIKLSAPQEKEIAYNPVTKYVIEHTVYHMCSASKPSLSDKLCSIVTDLQYMFYKLLLSRSAKDLMDDLSEAKKVVSKSPSHRQILQHCIRFVHRYVQTLRSMPQMVFQCALNDPQDIGSHICLEQYIPAQHFPGLELYLELINKPHSPASAITEYHCENEITSLTKSPDGKLLICSDSKGKIYIWDKYTGDLLQEEVIVGRDFFFPIHRCSVSPDGSLILYGNLTEAVNINGATVPLFSKATPDPWEINTCIFSPDGKFVVAWTYFVDGSFRLFSEIQMDVAVKFTVQIWDRDKAISTTLEEVTIKEVRPLCACISCDSKFVACGHRDGRIMLWETSTKRPKAMLLSDGATIREGPFKPGDSPEDNPINDIVYSLNGHYLAASHSKGITVWDAASLNFIQNFLPSNDILKVHTNVKFCFCSFSADSKNIVAGLSNGYIHVWNKQPGPTGTYALQLSSKPHGSSDPVTPCFFDDHKNIICAVRSSICIYAYDSLLKYPPIESLALHPKYATTCAILPDGRTVLTCGHGSIYSWNVAQACQISKTQSTVSGHLMQLSADGKLALTFGEGCLVQVWETETLKNKTSVYSNTCSSTSQNYIDDPDYSSPQEICSCAVSIHGTVVGGTGEGDIYIWYGENNTSVNVLKEHKALITSIAFSREGDRFVSGDMDGGITMWKIDNKSPNGVDITNVPMQGHGDSTEQVIFSVGHLQRIVSCGLDKMVHMYNGLTGELINRMAGHSSPVLKIAYSASGELLVSGDEKSQLILWDGYTGQPKQHFSSHSGHLILDLYFSGEDEYVCSRDSNQDFIQVYSVSSGACVSQMDFSSPVSTFAASSLKEESQSHIICGLKDGSIKFLRLKNALTIKQPSDGAPNGSPESSITEGNTAYLELQASESAAHTPQEASPISMSTTTSATSGRTGKLDIDRDVLQAKMVLQYLTKDELMDVFRELGLYDHAVRNEYSASLSVYISDLLRAWILGKDGVLQSEIYQGGATWENLRSALISLNHRGTAEKV